MHDHLIHKKIGCPRLGAAYLYCAFKAGSLQKTKSSNWIPGHIGIKDPELIDFS